jgi:hypothetical protein
LKRVLRKFHAYWRALLSRVYSTTGISFLNHLSSKVHEEQYVSYLKAMQDGAPIDTGSFQYKILNLRSFQESWLNSQNVPLIGTITSLISENPNLKTCIDLGSGTGWVSNILSEKFSRVVSIEPSTSAIEISKHCFGYGYSSNIEWMQGFAEEILPELDELSGPTFVFTGVVLSHTPNSVAKKILRYFDENLLIGSAGLLVEAWGNPRSEKLWHIRSKAWWQENLSNCEIDFYGPERVNVPGEFLGLKFRKIR